MSFNITVASQSSDPVSIAIFVNPSKITQTNHTLYSDMFPVAWRVYEFPGGPYQMPITDVYTPSYRAFVGGTTTTNLITCSSSAMVTEDAKSFDIRPTSSGAVQMTIFKPKSPEAADITMNNRTGETQLLGVSDAAGNPYLAINTKDSGTTEFVCLFEFAAVVVTNIKKGELFKGDTRMPFVTFHANDVRAGSVDMNFNGALIKVQGVTVDNHSADERPFAA